MDEAVIKYYRSLLKEDFPNSGELLNPSIFVEAVGEKLINCGNTGNYMQLYIQISNHRIEEIKYLCACDPTANVAVEIMCNLIKGMILEDTAEITEEHFYQYLESRDEQLLKKIRGLLELLHEGIKHYYTLIGAKEYIQKDGEKQDRNLSWDSTLTK